MPNRQRSALNNPGYSSWLLRKPGIRVQILSVLGDDPDQPKFTFFLNDVYLYLGNFWSLIR